MLEIEYNRSHSISSPHKVTKEGIERQSSDLLQTVVEVVPDAATSPAPWPQIELGAGDFFEVIFDAPGIMTQSKPLVLVPLLP